MGSKLSSEKNVANGETNGVPPGMKVIRSGGEEFIEGIVCDLSDLKAGDLKEVQLGDNPVLLAREDDAIHAVGAKCSHYGVGLAKGTLCKGSIRCPAHGACFNLVTGDIEDFPGLDSIHTFKVRVENDKIKVRAKKSDLENFRRKKAMVKEEERCEDRVVIVGGGPAAVVCAETLRQEGFTGRITMVSSDANLPYDRCKLSKGLESDAQKIALRTPDFYSSNGIEVLTNTTVEKLNTTLNTVTFTNGDSLFYKQLLLATGARAKTLPVPGSNLENIVTLRSIEDAAAIMEKGQDKDVVIIGASFIGVEIAASFGTKVKSLALIDGHSAPFQRIMGPEVGSAVLNLIENNLPQTKFYFDASIKEFIGDGNKLRSVVLGDGQKIDADLCILGIGAQPNTEWLQNSGLLLTLDNYVTVDKRMHTSKQDVYAAGDITQFPLFICNDELTNIQHWQMAQQQGRIAALNMLGKQKDIVSVPFFWSSLFGKSVRYTGYAASYDDVIIHGDLGAGKFVAYYVTDDKVVAVSSMNYDPYVARAADCFLHGQNLTKELITSNPDTWHLMAE